MCSCLHAEAGAEDGFNPGQSGRSPQGSSTAIASRGEATRHPPHSYIGNTARYDLPVPSPNLRCACAKVQGWQSFTGPCSTSTPALYGQRVNNNRGFGKALLLPA